MRTMRTYRGMGMRHAGACTYSRRYSIENSTSGLLLRDRENEWDSRVRTREGERE